MAQVGPCLRREFILQDEKQGTNRGEDYDAFLFGRVFAKLAAIREIT